MKILEKVWKFIKTLIYVIQKKIMEIKKNFYGNFKKKIIKF